MHSLFYLEHISKNTAEPPRHKGLTCLFYATYPILNWNKLVSAITVF